MLLSFSIISTNKPKPINKKYKLCDKVMTSSISVNSPGEFDLYFLTQTPSPYTVMVFQQQRLAIKMQTYLERILFACMETSVCAACS